MNRVELIESKIKEAFNNAEFKLIDNSSAHASHPEAQKSGGGHYQLHICSDKFTNLSTLEQHKLVYAALNDLITDNTIHALSIHTSIPN